jgi:DNA-binding NarL/FixJ family response regulator
VTGSQYANGLSPRRWEVLHLAARGLTDKEIAARLCIGVGTVRFHFAGCRRVLGARTRPQATALAAARGLIDPL